MAIKLRMKRKAFPATEGPDKAHEALIRLWVLRLLVPLGGHREFLAMFGYQNESPRRATDAMLRASAIRHCVVRVRNATMC